MLVQRNGARRTPGRLLVAAALLLPLAIAGCATKLTRPELVEQLRAVGGGKPGVRVVPIHADTRMEAYARLGEARSEPRTALSRDLGQQFKITRTRRLTFIVGGPYPDLSDQVVINALEYNQGKPLPGLTLVYVSPAPPSEKLVQVATQKRARLYHKRLAVE